MTSLCIIAFVCLSQSPDEPSVWLTLESNGSSKIKANGGDTIEVALIAYLRPDSCRGLGFFSVDLEADGGTITPMNRPNKIAAQFAPPLGIGLPNSPGGVSLGSRLLQFGGGQNIFGANTTGSFPEGEVLLEVGKEPLTLGVASWTLPNSDGIHRLDIGNACIHVIAEPYGLKKFPLASAGWIEIQPLKVCIGPSLSEIQNETRVITSLDVEVQARLGDSVSKLNEAEQSLFQKGFHAFARVPTVEEGLGPFFTSSSCVFCHNHPTSGGMGAVAVTRFGRKTKEPDGFDLLLEKGGPVLHFQCIDGAFEESIPEEANLVIQRRPTPLFGAGLVELISDDRIVHNEKNPPSKKVHGAAHWVPSLIDGSARVGRFGWKGSVASILEFTAKASVEELGITNRFFPSENTGPGDLRLVASLDGVIDPEDREDENGLAIIDYATLYQQWLAPPPQTPKKGLRGEVIFRDIGCADCHLAVDYETNANLKGPLKGQSFRPYSDFLIHDMGELGDGFSEGGASGSEMLTRSLWGIAYNLEMLHDGRARGGSHLDRLSAAIEEHKGEGEESRKAFDSLGDSAKSELTKFITSLGRAEFDANSDNRVDRHDWRQLSLWITGPNPKKLIDPNDDAALGDLDGDGDFDLLELGAFLRLVAPH